MTICIRKLVDCVMRRLDNREYDQLRHVAIIANYYSHGDGSCFVKFGNTHVICSATIDRNVPLFLRGSNSGWITAEYGMLPGAGSERIKREASGGKQSGRTHEIQRLISRSLRSVVDLSMLDQKQIKIDCDVIQADGGTRTASITGAFVAMYLACKKIDRNVGMINDSVVAVSCGIVDGTPLLDINYSEDSNADVDANFVMSKTGIIEVQACGEKRPFTEDELQKLMDLAKSARETLISIQNNALGI